MVRSFVSVQVSLEDVVVSCSEVGCVLMFVEEDAIFEKEDCYELVLNWRGYDCCLSRRVVLIYSISCSELNYISKFTDGECSDPLVN